MSTLERVSEGYSKAQEPDVTTQDLRDEFMDDFEDFRRGLETGEFRAAEKVDGEWEAVPEVKEGILLAFNMGENEIVEGAFMDYKDKDTLPPQTEIDGARTVPGGTSVRSGAYVGEGTIIMPPAYINVGGYVGENSMVDSHALVGSAAQVGEDVHLSTHAALGGVLEPINRAPVVVEDGAMIGGHAGIYEGVIVEEDAVVAPGVEISGSTEIYDAVNDEVYTGTVPEGAVVIPGSVEYGEVNGDIVNKDVALVPKYRDESTDANTALEEALR